MSEVWTVGRVVKWAADDFRARGIESPRLDAELLLAMVLEIDRIRVITDAARELSPEELAAYRELIRRRRAHEPVAYLRGEREFYGRVFKVDARVLVPRPDTETLVEVALDRTRTRSMSGRALDLCTGSGCVAITFARERPTWRVDGTDLSPGALDVARANAARLGAIWNVRWLVADVFGALEPGRDAYDLITANPPYIPHDEVARLPEDVRGYEPHMALDGGDDGLSVIDRILDGSPRFLRPGGVLAIEVMAGQGGTVAERMAGAGFDAVELRRDYGGHDRVASGVRGDRLRPRRA